MGIKKWNVDLAIAFLVALFFSEALCAQSPISAPSPIIVQIQSPHRDSWDYALISIQIATFISLIIYVIKTWEMAAASKRSTKLSEEVLTEMKEARIQELAPNVIVYIDMPYGNTWSMYFVVRNIGKAVAKDIMMEFDPPLQTGLGNHKHEYELPLVKNGIRSLAPGQEIRAPFDVATNYFSNMARKLESPLPVSYNVRVSYLGGLQTDKICTEQIIDLTMFKNIWYLEERDSEQTKAIKTLAEANSRMRYYVEAIADTLAKGIWIKNPESPISGLHISAEAWRFAALGKLKEFRIIWTAIYTRDYRSPIRSYFEDLQTRFLSISSQILFIASIAPTDDKKEVIDSLTQVVLKMNELGEVRWFMDGEVPEPDFNTTGDEVVKLVDKAMEMLQRTTHTETEYDSLKANKDLELNEMLPGPRDDKAGIL